MPQASEFNLPDPNYQEQGEALQTLITQSVAADGILRHAGMEHEADMLRIRALTEVTNRAYTMARTLGLQAIAEGRLSRVELSRMMGIHQQTVADWIKKAKADPNHDYVKEPLHATNPVYLADRESA